MWWTYFDRFAAVAQERLSVHADPVLAAADGYSYLHLVIVAGIIIFAVGVKFLVRAAGSPLHDAARLALCGGVALYLIGNVAFRLRMVGTIDYEKVALAGALVLLYALGGNLAGWVLAGCVALLLVALCAIETAAEPPPRKERLFRALVARPAPGRNGR
jgi:low temperature requirement protein LtrA